MTLRFRLRAGVIVIAFVGLALAVVAIAIDNRRLARELQAARGASVDRYDRLVYRALQQIARPQPAQYTKPSEMPDGSDAVVSSTSNR
jgi:hypothetical protein